MGDKCAKKQCDLRHALDWGKVLLIILPPVLIVEKALIMQITHIFNSVYKSEKIVIKEHFEFCKNLSIF